MPSTPLPQVSNLSAFTKDQDFNTYHTMVTLAPDDCGPTSCRNPAKFINHINANFKGSSNTGDVRLHMVSVTLGSADVIIVWQARTTEAAKDFMEKVLSGYHCQTNTQIAMWSHGQGGI
jgi:hypothetical protein